MSNGGKKYKAISKHSVTRGKQRLGNTKNGISLAAKRARKDGLEAHLVKGALHDEMVKHAGNLIIYYANAIYIFGKTDALITVLNKGTLFDKELYKYTSYGTFVSYTYARYKYTENKEKMYEILNEGYNYIVAQINEYIAPYLAKCDHIYADPYTKNKYGQANISCDGTLPTEIVEKIKNDFGLVVMYLNAPKEVNPNETMDHARIIKDWFSNNYNINVKVSFADGKYTILRTATSSPVKVISEKVQKSYEKAFKSKLYIRYKGDRLSNNVLVPEKIAFALKITNWLQNYTSNYIIFDIDKTNVEIQSNENISEDLKDNFYKEFNKVLLVSKRG